MNQVIQIEKDPLIPMVYAKIFSALGLNNNICIFGLKLNWVILKHM